MMPSRNAGRAAVAPVRAFDIDALSQRLAGGQEGERLTGFCGGMVGIAAFSEHPLWERHPRADELLHVLDGALDLTILGEDGPTELQLTPGSLVVVPRGLWHSPRPRGFVRLLFINTSEETEISDLPDPRPPNDEHGNRL